MAIDFTPLHEAQLHMKELVEKVRKRCPDQEASLIACAISTAALTNIYLLLRESGLSDDQISQSMVLSAVAAPMMFDDIAQSSRPLQ